MEDMYRAKYGERAGALQALSRWVSVPNLHLFINLEAL